MQLRDWEESCHSSDAIASHSYAHAAIRVGGFGFGDTGPVGRREQVVDSGTGLFLEVAGGNGSTSEDGQRSCAFPDRADLLFWVSVRDCDGQGY